MFLETIKTEGLAHFSYVLGDEAAGLCAVIDPRRDVEVYLDLARRHKVRLAYILETHIHADFVSGSRELAAQTGAPIGVGENGDYGFEHRPLQEGEILEIGELNLKVLHTPGHTPEHICYLVSGGAKAKQSWGLFTGDTLFAGEVGRPDLLEGATEEELAQQLYHSLFKKLLQLGDEIIIYPAHGEGSPCGASIGGRQTSSIGYERRYNERLQAQSEPQFVKEVLNSLSPSPSYYAYLKRLNAAGPPALGTPLAIEPLTPAEFRQEMAKPNTQVVDTREIEAFGGAHIGQTLNIALRTSFPIWAGWLLKPEERILLILNSTAELDRVQRHLLRIGCKNVMGYLRQGIRSWLEAGRPFEQIPQLSVHQLRQRILDPQDELQLLDVRSDKEWEQGHIPTAQHHYLPYLSASLDTLDPLKPIATYCGSGYRASMAASILQQHGFGRVYNVPGSISAWQAAGYPLELPFVRAQLDTY